LAKPVFYDPSGKRRRASKNVVLGIIVALFLALAVLIFSILSVAVPKALPYAEREQSIPLPAQISPLRNALKKLGAWIPTARKGALDVKQLRVGFYVPWDPDSRTSLEKNIGALDWVAPVTMTIYGEKHQINLLNDPKFDALMSSDEHKQVKVFPVLQNAQNDTWDGAGLAALLRDPRVRASMITQLIPVLKSHNGAGIVYDFEELPQESLADYLKLIEETKARFKPLGWQVTLTLSVAESQSPQAERFAQASDKIFVMNYDEHDTSSQAGPIASQKWFVDNLSQALRHIPANKMILAIGSYAYDWHGGRVDNMSVEEAWFAAKDTEALPTFDKMSGNPTFSYKDEEDNQVHNIWFLDAASAWNQLMAADTQGVAGVALWRLGSEDPGFWPVLDKFESHNPADISQIQSTAFNQIDPRGKGELLRIVARPTLGARELSYDKQNAVRDETYTKLPSPFVTLQYGYKPKMVALTFDDGPDGTYTPQILDILERKHAPATFFLIGENVLEHPTIVNRIFSGGSGSEIGSHSYTHPNLAQDSSQGVKLELSLTQRVIQAYTGRSVRLFRAPYFGDAEPTTNDELLPATQAQDEGYTNVGLHVDSEDWQRPGVNGIIANTLNALDKETDTRSAQIILLHDGGGDRQQTVDSLPQLIDSLRARGYEIVPVSRLAGLKTTDVMPEIKGRELWLVRADVGIFLLAAGVMHLLKWIFYAAISLGIARAFMLALLALWSHFSRMNEAMPDIDSSLFVTVLIPAFNEAKVIEDSVQRVLASEEIQLEVIVIDDGSSDGTGEIVRKAFGQDTRVTLLELENGGKARALNAGINISKGEIIISLDADTQFEPLTITRLARWFSNPKIGAVAGNAKVGNKINLATRWQAIEYITAQNLERRALDQLEAITVVPGAVGAWRKQALADVGGYPVDTLAEDQDLTISIQRKGWEIAYDVEAVAWTEAPESFRALARQRFRWAFGTLQCLWKHNQVIKSRTPAGLAYIGLPQAWVFQIAFAVISPIIDSALLLSLASVVVRIQQHGWAQTHSDVLTMGVFWLMFTSIDALCGWIAYRLEPQKQHYPVFLLIGQRFMYRQIMYWVVLKAVSAALRGPHVGWGKLERTGSVEM
jgi:peptidoglycan-N-acetylglucosamine deacetylase